MPELPEVETTRRGIAPHVVGRRIVRVDVYDRRLRWPVPADLARAHRAGARSTAIDRRSKYLLFRLGAAALLVHLGMTGTLRVCRDPPAARQRTITSTSFSTTARCCAITIRAASARCCGSPSANDGHPLLAALGPGALRPGLRRRLPVAHDAHAPRVDQARADGQPRRHGRRQHLRERGAVSRRHPAGRRARAGCRRRGSRGSSTPCATYFAPRSPRAAARCATTSAPTAGRVTSSSTISSTGAQGEPCRVCGAPIRPLPHRPAHVVPLPALPAPLRRGGAISAAGADGARRLAARDARPDCRRPCADGRRRRLPVGVAIALSDGR